MLGLTRAFIKIMIDHKLENLWNHSWIKTLRSFFSKKFTLFWHQILPNYNGNRFSLFAESILTHSLLINSIKAPERFVADSNNDFDHHSNHI